MNHSLLKEKYDGLYEHHERLINDFNTLHEQYDRLENQFNTLALFKTTELVEAVSKELWKKHATTKKRRV